MAPTVLTSRKSAELSQTRAGIRLLMQHDLFALAKVLYAEWPNQALSRRFHGPMCLHANAPTHKKNLWLVFRGSQKTSVLNEVANVQRILKNQDIRILIASGKSELAEAMLAGIKAHLTHPDLLACFPEILHADPARQADDWTKSRITIKRKRKRREPTIDTIGVTGELTSRHYDHITCDDVVGKENSQTREELAKVIEFVRLLVPLLDPGGTQDFIGCLPASADVLLESGETRPIDTIKAGDRVWAADEDGTLAVRSVTAMIPQGEAETVTVATTGRTLRATPNHPFLALRHTRLEWVRADELIPGEYVVAIKAVPGQLDHAWMPEEFAWLFGFLLGDGWTGVKGHRGYIGIALSLDETLNARVLEVAGRWLSRGTFRRLPDRTARSDARADAEFLQALGLVGGAKTKRLPAWAFRLPAGHRRALLRGFCDADGTRTRSKADTWRVEIVNRGLLDDLRHLASLCGVRIGPLASRRREIQAPNSPAPVISETWACSFNFTVADQNEFQGIGRGRGFRLVPRTAPLPDAGLRPERVVSVTPNPIPEPVYDLTVEGTPSFFANGLAVHNTPWHYADAYAYLLEQRKRGMDLGYYRLPCWVADPGLTRPGAMDVPGFGRIAPTFPERFPIPTLLGFRADMGSADFASHYLLDPVSADTAVFVREKLRSLPAADMPHPGSLWVVMTVDPASSDKKWADYSAIAATGFDNQGDAYVLDLRRGRWSEAELIHQVYDVYDGIAHRGGRVICVGFEAIGFAKTYRHLFVLEGDRRGQYLNIVKLERDTKQAKPLRIRTLQPMWERGSLIVQRDVPAFEELLDEASRFRLDRESTHDDLLDALADAYQMRARPGLGGQAEPTGWLAEDDPIWRARRTFDKTLPANLDSMSRRVAWDHHQRRQAERDRQEVVAVGAGGDEFFGI